MGLYAILHVANKLTIRSTLIADFCTFPAYVRMMLRIHQYEMCSRPANFGTRHHQAEMVGRDMFASDLEAVGHCVAEASFIAGKAIVDA